jgi:hypothetical protein
MSRHVVVNCEDKLAPFMERHCHSHGAFTVGRAVGLVDVHDDREPEILASVWFDSFNGANVNIHVAALPGRRWLNREFLWYGFHCPFNEWGVKRVTGLVASSNYDARRFDEHLGFKLEATLKDAAPDGDMLVYVMFKKDCRWLNVRNNVPPMKGVH